jgi:Ras GTPase-activating-like protein IQGAP2/3
MRERQKRLSQTSAGDGSDASLADTPPATAALPDTSRPASRSSVRSTSSIVSAQVESPSSSIPSIKEPPLGARRGPAARLGRHMPRIASGDGQFDEDVPSTATPARPSAIIHSQSLGPSYSSSRWGEGVRSVGEGDEVVGMKGRRRLPLASSSALGPGSSPAATAGLRISTFAIERTRKEVIAEEYLTHVGEALQWVEGVLQEDLGFGVVEFEEKLRDGVVLAKIAKQLDGLKKGERIFEVRHGL